MNRLSPLIARSPIPAGPREASSSPLSAFAAANGRWDGVERRRPDPYAAAKEFLTFWLAGALFFGTLIA